MADQRVKVEAPAVTPAKFGLLQTATSVDDPGDAWKFSGVFSMPGDCDESGVTLAGCPVPDLVDAEGYDVEFDPTKTVPANGQRTAEGDAFTVYSALACSATSFDDQEWLDRVTTKLTLGEGRAVERGFWTGEALGAVDVINPHLARGADVDLPADSDPLRPVTALAVLEAAWGECNGGLGIVHAPPSLSAPFSEAGLVKNSGERLVTQMGHLVAFGGGYPGSSPFGVDPATVTQAWMFMSGPMTYRRSAVTIVGRRPNEYINRATNDAQLIAERTYVLNLDDCCILAVLVDIDACCGTAPTVA